MTGSVYAVGQRIALPGEAFRSLHAILYQPVVTWNDTGDRHYLGTENGDVPKARLD